jgi:hypothetical protein
MGKPRRKRGRRRKDAPRTPPKPHPPRVAPTSPDAAILRTVHADSERFQSLAKANPPGLRVAWITLLCVVALVIAGMATGGPGRSKPRRAETRGDASPRGGLLLVRLTQPLSVSQNGIVRGHGSTAIPLGRNDGVVLVDVGSRELSLGYRRDPKGVALVARAPGGVWADGRPESDTLSLVIEREREVTLYYRTATRQVMPPVVLRLLQY